MTAVTATPDTEASLVKTSLSPTVEVHEFPARGFATARFTALLCRSAVLSQRASHSTGVGAVGRPQHLAQHAVQLLEVGDAGEPGWSAGAQV